MTRTIRTWINSRRRRALAQELSSLNDRELAALWIARAEIELLAVKAFEE